MTQGCNIKPELHFSATKKVILFRYSENKEWSFLDQGQKFKTVPKMRKEDTSNSSIK